jgi:ribosome-associated heat shock protein Hsp15
MDSPTEVRIDKWLWCVRLFKSRSLATAACASGKVRIGGERIKPSRSVKVGDIITVPTGNVTRTVKVVSLLEHRVGAKFVADYMEDRTPAAEYLKPRDSEYSAPGVRPSGMGRPTKKQRRQLEGFWGSPAKD